MSEPPTVSTQDRLLSLGLVFVVIAGFWFLFLRGGSSSAPAQEDWSKPYESTTCSDWSNEMIDDDRYVMAAVMLQVLQRIEDLDADPSYNKSNTYKRAITAACAGSHQLVFTIADQVYAADPRFGP